MFKFYLARFLVRVWGLLLAAGAICTMLGFAGWKFLYDYDRLNPALTPSDVMWLGIWTTLIGVVLIIACVFTKKPIDKLRAKGLEESRFDEYGRLKGQDDYYNLSVQAQKKMDEERKRKMNQVLPMAEVKQLTKKGSLNPVEDLHKLIGLENVKEKVEEIEAQLEFNKKHKIENAFTSANHMNMYGPPGTGKTTVARIIAGLFHKYGLIKRNEVIEVGGSALTNADASLKVEALCQHSYGGMLFIDEAYAMANSPYGQEAIAALIKEMEDSKDKFVLILAGYENEMRELLSTNPGFMSRIKEHFYFASYSDNELLDIIVAQADSSGYKITEGGLVRVLSILQTERHNPNFGNARTCRNLVEKAISKHPINIRKGLSDGDFLLNEHDFVVENVL